MINIMHRKCGIVLEVEDLQKETCPCCSEHFGINDIFCGRPDDSNYVSERERYTKTFIHIANEIITHVRGTKTSDYGETWKRLGLMGLYVKLFIKEGRLNELIWKKGGTQVASKNESVRDTLLDMAAYSIYGMIALDEGNINGEESVEEHLKAMRDAINERLGDKK